MNSPIGISPTPGEPARPADLTSAAGIAEYLQSCGFSATSTGGGFSAWIQETAVPAGKWKIMLTDWNSDTDMIKPGHEIGIALYNPEGVSPEAKFEIIANADALPEALSRFRQIGEAMFGTSPADSPNT